MPNQKAQPKMKTLLLDIETAPSIVYAWGLFKQNIAISQIEEPGYTLCWAAKWLSERTISYASVHEDGESEMLAKVYDLLEEADVVVHYNGSKFDIPTLNREFISHGYAPPAPFQEVDLLKTCRNRFRFLSNKLDYVAQQLTGEGKVETKGMSLWRDCMAGCPKAWAIMKKYNKRDVTILEGVYEHLLPWIQPHPNMALFNDDEDMQCPNCGGTHLQSRGSYYTHTQRYQRYQCQDCGKWTRSRINDVPADKRAAVLAGVK